MPLPSNYPKQYADQEERVLAQIAARRKAFLQRSGQAEQQFTQAAPQPAEMVQQSSVPAASGEEKMMKDLFSGNVLG